MRACKAFVVCLCLVAASACGSNGSPSAPGGGGSTLAAPALASPAEAAQLSSLRPTLIVNNASSQSGTRVYEFQISDRSDFSTAATTSAGFTVFASRAGVPEGTGTTSYTLDVDLQPATRMYWRSRASQETTTSDWSAARTLNTQIVGYNRAGELYDPLFGGTTIGTPVGSTTFIPGKGIQINDEASFVRYQLAQTITNGEMSVEVEGIYGNGPGAKLKIFSMMDGTGDLLDSKYLLHVQYRGGLDGNPNNSFAYKALFGDEDFKFEPDFGARAASVMILDRNKTYFWKATWSNEFRLLVQDGRGGPTIYNHGTPSRGSTYNPNPHFAYLGTNNRFYSGEETGSWPGAIYRNLWIGTGTRPSSLGSAFN